MNEPNLKAAAYALAEATPRHLDQPTTPPIHWRQEGDILRVLLADGRTVRGLVPVLARGGPINQPKPTPTPAKAKIKTSPPSNPISSPSKKVAEKKA